MKPSTAKKLLKLNYNLYENEASAWNTTRGEIWEQPVIDFTNKLNNGCLLDLGCGNARLYQILEKKEIDYLGVDPSKSFIALDQKKYPKAKFQVSDGLTLNYSDKFNYVLSLAVLHHIPGDQLQQQFMNNIYKSLKPNGQIFLSVWNRWQNRYQKYFKTKKPFTDMEDSDLLVPWKNTKHSRFIHAFTETELYNLAKNTGFKKINIFYANKNGITNKNDGLNLYLTAIK